MEEIFVKDNGGDLLSYVPQSKLAPIMFVWTNKETLNTPNKENLTGCVEGIAMILGTASYRSIFFFPSASAEIFAKRMTNNEWDKWRKLQPVEATTIK